MDCDLAGRLVSDALDVGDEDVPGIEEARAHCARCPECARFAAGLANLVQAPSPKAPDSLIEETAARAMAAWTERLQVATAPEEFEGAPREVDPPDAARPRRPDRRRLPRFAAIAASLAVFAGVVALVTHGIDAGTAPNMRATSVSQKSADSERAVSPPTAPASPLSGTTSGSAPATGQLLAVGSAPQSYVVLDGFVYSLLGERSIDVSELADAGTVTTALSAQGAAATRPASKRSGSSGTPDAIFLRDGDALLAFQLVTRQLGGQTFALRSPDVYRFGDWPSLPSSYPTPVAPNGSPTFSTGGKDSQGVSVFPAAGTTPDKGFAIAPGTSPTDPAAGNPNWTWWSPVVKP